MIRSLSSLLVVVVGGLLSSGCASKPPPPPSIQSQPVGAEVWIKRHGIRRAEGGIAGIGGVKASGTKFEEKDFVQVGLTPCNYYFPKEEKESSVGVGGLGGSTSWKVFKGGIVEIRMPGYKTWKRSVPFGSPGGRLMVDAVLEQE